LSTTYFNFAGKPLPSFKFTATAIPVLIRIINISHDSEVLHDALWALSYLTDGTEERIQMVIEMGILEGLAKTLE
jgi:hypothetical protein